MIMPEKNTIHHLVYVSEKSQHFSDHDIDDIIEHSQKNNARGMVTGLLINNGKFFIQLLEGKKEEVMRAFHRISSDHRHFRIRILYTADSEARLFPEWAMGLVREPTENTMNQILPELHSEILGHAEVRSKIQATLRKFNSSGKSAA